MTIRQAIHARDPYEGFDANRYPLAVAGWHHNDEIFARLITEHRPKLIVEVGSWLGGSAITMANVCRDLGLETHIVCVDTWLGSLEMWEDQGDESRYKALRCVNGYPSLYYQFLANVVHSGHAERVTPFPVPSTIAAVWFQRHWNTSPPEMIYLDASHEQSDLHEDIGLWYPVKLIEGVLFGDDYDNQSFPGVKSAVDSFGKPTVTPSGKWIL